MSMSSLAGCALGVPEVESQMWNCEMYVSRVTWPNQTPGREPA
jgi:hypothetical protein